MREDTYNAIQASVQEAMEGHGIDATRQPVVREFNGEAMADSRDVAAFFGKEHKDVLRAIRNLHCSDGFRQRNFAPFKNKDLTGENTSHVLMTKDGFTFVVLGFTGEKAAKFKEAYITRFNTMEAALRNPRPAGIDYSDPKVLLGAFQHLQEQVAEKEQVIAALTPKAEALDRIAEAEGSLCITDAAKALQMRPKELFAYLRAHGWIYRRTGSPHDLGYQSKVAAGLLEHKVTTVLRADGTEKLTEQVRITPKGLAALAKLFPPAVAAE